MHVHVFFCTLRHPRDCLASAICVWLFIALGRLKCAILFVDKWPSAPHAVSHLALLGVGNSHSRSQLFVSLCVFAELPSVPAHALQWQFCISKLCHSIADIFQPVKEFYHRRSSFQQLTVREKWKRSSHCPFKLLVHITNISMYIFS